MQTDRRRRVSVAAGWRAAVMALLAAPPLLAAAELAATALPGPCDRNWALAWLDWFDPMFFTYSAALAVTAVLAVPGVVVFYVKTMKGEKLRRLQNDLSEEHWKKDEAALRTRVASQFALGNYAGSLAMLTLVILLGCAIILLLKPVPDAHTAFGCGVDYSRGASFLLLGPYLAQAGAGPNAAYYHHVIISLTAFQFGFLGAYVYLIGDIVRSYFMLDLSPRTLVASTIRIVTGSLLALVLSFVIAHPLEALDPALPVVAFFLGHFPETALVYLQRKVTSLLGIAAEQSDTIALPRLPGIGYAQETRLVREGFDNVQTLANARPLDLVMATGFSYRQARQWVAQAWLCSHLGGEHYEDFRACTGITSADELAQWLAAAPRPGAEAVDRLAEATGGRYPHKLAIVCALVPAWRERVERSYVA